MSAVDLRDADAHFKRLDEGIRAGAVRGLQSAALRGLQVILVEIIPSRSPQPVDRGLFRAGWKVFMEHDGASIENNEPHAPVIEFGVRAESVKIGRKLIAALAEWVVRKRLATGAEAVSAAWAIAKAMQKRGIFNRFGAGLPGTRILQELVNLRLPNIVSDEVRREIERELDRRG